MAAAEYLRTRGCRLFRNTATRTTIRPTDNGCPSAIGGSAASTALRRRSCNPRQRAKSHPIPGLIPWNAPNPNRTTHGQIGVIDSALTSYFATRRARLPSREAIGIRRSVAAFQANLVQPIFFCIEEEFRI